MLKTFNKHKNLFLKEKKNFTFFAPLLIHRIIKEFFFYIKSGNLLVCKELYKSLSYRYNKFFHPTKFLKGCGDKNLFKKEKLFHKFTKKKQRPYNHV